jgi:hypothetical protein
MSIEVTRSDQPSPEVLGMLDQFNTTTHQTFIAALEHYTADGVNPGLLGKPINLLKFHVERPHDANIDEFSLHPIVRESLGVCVGRPAYIDVFARYPLYKQMPPVEKRQHKKIVDTVRDVCIEENMCANELIPREAVWSGYTAAYLKRAQSSKANLGVSTYELPSTGDDFEKISGMTTALLYARDALAYVVSLPYPTGDPAHEGIIHCMKFIPTPELSPFLNGHEPLNFLQEYKATMAYEYERACNFLKRTRQECAPDTRAIELVEQYEQALGVINKILPD